MHVGTKNDQPETSLTMLEHLLRLHGDFRRTLEPIKVTPLQAGLMLFLHRCSGARVMEAAGALRVRPPTLTDVVQDLVRKRWVTKRRSVEDRRALRLRLSRRGEAITRTIESQVRHLKGTLTEHDGCALGISPQGGHA
jgi:DNA-binding MarR family transcriptional regulator